MGALIGRVAVEIFQTPAHESHAIVKHCALFGAVAFLGGVLRSTVSLCIIISEGTGQTNLLIPIILTTIVSKATANFIQPDSGLYELIMALKNYPHLSRDPSKKASLLRTIDLVQDQNLITFERHVTVREVLEKLRSCTHNGFPVVSRSGMLQGLVIREALLLLLEYFSETELDMVLELELVMNQGPSVVLYNSPVSQCVLLFTSVGLRHVVVIDSSGVVVGIVTRCDLVELDAFEYIGHQQREYSPVPSLGAPATKELGGSVAAGGEYV